MSEQKKKTATRAATKTSKASMRRPDIISPLAWLVLTTLSRGTSAKSTYNVRVAMELGKGKQWHIAGGSVNNTVKKKSKS